MNQEDIINFLELASIVIAGALGMASTLTETKNAKGKLTKWGYIALIGILAANTFSFVQSYLKHAKEHKEQMDAAEQQQKAAKQQHIRDSTEKVQFREQVQLLTANLKKADSSLEQQSDIQKRTSNVLTRVRQSLKLQNRIFKQSETLTTQQNVVAESMDRSLHPLLPFKVNIAFSIQADENSFPLLGLTNKLKDKTQEAKSLIGSATKVDDLEVYKIKQVMQEGVLPLLPEMKSFGVMRTYPDFDSLVKKLTDLYINFSFSQTQNSPGSLLTCEVPMDFLHNSNNFKNVQINFRPASNSYEFSLEDLPVKVTSELKVGSYSTRDLEGKIFNLTIGNSPGLIQRAHLIFKFPPDFSRINQIKNKGKGENSLSKYHYYTYSYTARCNLLR